MFITFFFKEILLYYKHVLNHLGTVYFNSVSGFNNYQDNIVHINTFGKDYWTLD